MPSFRSVAALRKCIDDQFAVESDDKRRINDFEEVYVRVAKRSERRRDGNGRDHPHRWRIAMQSHPERCLNIYIHTHVMYAIIIIIIIIIIMPTS